MDFNRQQEEIINATNGNISVIATAGSGKTTVLVHRIARIVQNQAAPGNILAVTFSKKAKDNITGKLEKLGIHGTNVETFHSLALKIITSACGADRYKVWTSQWEKEKTLQDICKSLGLCSPDSIPSNDIMSFIALQKIKMLEPDGNLVYTDDQPFRDTDMKNIYSLYEKTKKEKAYIEFDDFLNMANGILDNNPGILEAYREKFKYVLADEFQDISLSQWLLLKKINTTDTMIVGDPLQAIYSFRGGDNSYILGFDASYKDVKVVNLNTNYRCSMDIVKTANSLAASMPGSRHKDYTESVADNGEYKKPLLLHFHDAYDEAAWISQKIYKLAEEGYQLDDIAILSRTNAQLQVFETALHDSGIAFDIVDGKTFTSLPEIKLVISYLKLALCENDNEAFKYIYNNPNRWLDRKFFRETEENSIKRKVSLYASMSTIRRRNWRFKNGIDEIYEVVRHLQDTGYPDVSGMIHYLRTRLDIDAYVTKGKQADDGGCTGQTDNLDSFENLCRKYKSVRELVHYTSELNKEAESSREQKVKLLTIHKSKGLEYPVVFIPGCNDGFLPHYKSNDTDDECRLFYVAITRAEKELYLSYADIYNDKLLQISPFIKNIRNTLDVKGKVIKSKKIIKTETGKEVKK